MKNCNNKKLQNPWKIFQGFLTLKSEFYQVHDFCGTVKDNFTPKLANNKPVIGSKININKNSRPDLQALRGGFQHKDVKYLRSRGNAEQPMWKIFLQTVLSLLSLWEAKSLTT